MNAGQYEGITGRLDAILAKMPAVPQLDPKLADLFEPEPAQKAEEPLAGSALARVKREALMRVLEALDGWIEGQKSNHEACDHRGENRGEECWRTWAPSDIRNMINDAARELGLAEFPAPREPEEDKAL
jgi:hypothetical protein